MRSIILLPKRILIQRSIVRCSPALFFMVRGMTSPPAIAAPLSHINSACDRKFFSSNSKNGSSLDEFRRKKEEFEEEFNKNLPVAESIVGQRRDRKQEVNEMERMKKIRREIMEAAMTFVPKFGWSKEAIAKGAESIGYPGVMHGMFPRGSVELIEYFYTGCTERLVEWMEKETEDGTNVVSGQEFIAQAVHLRLRMLEPYLNSWPQAIAIMSQRQNAMKSLANLLTLADQICYYSGDRAVDFAWYARRVGLAGIYKVTELYMLQDKSEDFKGTAIFLHRRMEEAVMLNKVLETANVPSNIKSSVESAFTTAKNLVEFNFPKRL